MKIFTTILMLLLVGACGSVGDASAQAINELKSNRLLVGPPGGPSTDTATFTVNDAIYSPYYGDVHLGTLTGTVGYYEAIQFFPQANGSVYSAWINPTMTPAASGTHTDFDVLRLEKGNILAGTAPVTNSTTLHIHGTPAGGINNRSIWVESGTSEFDGPIAANAGLTIPTGQSITGAGTAAITGFASASLGAISGTTGTFGAGEVVITNAGSIGLINLGETTTSGIIGNSTSAAQIRFYGATSGTPNAIGITGNTSVTGTLSATGPVKTGGSTVALLPAGTIGQRYYVTDQLTTCAVPGAALTGGGAVTCPVFYNGTAWVGD